MDLSVPCTRMMPAPMPGVRALSAMTMVSYCSNTQAFEAILGSGQPHDVLWPLLYTWSLVAKELSVGDPDFQNWQDAFQQLGLLESGFSERVEALDAYLDLATETINAWELAQETWV